MANSAIAFPLAGASGGQTLAIKVIDNGDSTYSLAVSEASGGGTARTIASSAPTTSGTVTGGAQSVSFLTSSDWSGSVNGTTRAASQAINISVVSPADTLPAIAYVISAGTLYIDKLT